MTLEVARDAVKRNDWTSAIEAFGEIDGETDLSPDDLVLLGDALWWSARPDEAEDAYQKAFDGFIRGGRKGEASTVGATLAYLAMRRMSESVAMGWVARVQDLLVDQEECPGHAWLALLAVAQALFVANDLEAVKDAADEAIGIARRQGVIGVEALALSFKGIAHTYQGDWREGMKMIDEATVIATSGSGDLRASSDVYCNLMGVCSSLADYKRAVEWTDQAERWMKSKSLGGFTGVCQVHRAELKRLRGDWSQAEHDARVACVELERFHLLNGLGFAHYEIGEVRRRMGDLDAAEEAFSRAYEYGHPAQPGLSLLLMDRGDLDAAAASIAGVLATTANDGDVDLLTRGHLLPAQIEIALARGDLGTAREAIAELEKVEKTYDSPAWEAMVLTCRGALALEEGQASEAVAALDRAWRLWQKVNLPYEMGRARELLGRARMATGDETAARLELRAAWSTYEKLGARLDLDRLQGTIGAVAAGISGAGERERKAFMFTDIVTSTDLVGLIGDEAWERLLDWHDRELRTAITTHGGDEVRRTGDGFFVAFDSARKALDAAVDIQRRLADHRVQHGFSPTIRIGIHHTEATRQTGDYVGHGVHVAARVGDLGAGDEIVVSEDLTRAAGTVPYQFSRVREVELKGVTDPVTVMNVDWHR
ncbi:MAG TPA: adenylate/guanylate cyclase domain-containing protein [Acidimicrobiia bacterium]